MPSKKPKLPSAPTAAVLPRTQLAAARRLQQHQAFFPLLILSLVLWVVYRSVFAFPIWFDETLGKAIFFGIPVWLYATVFDYQPILDSFAASKMKRGLLLGIAFGGLFGFAGSIFALSSQGSQVEAVMLFAFPQFWWEFFLSLMTAFWETLFFFSWVMTVIQDRYQRWPLLNQVLLTSAVFVVFHLPNTLLRFDASQVPGQLFLLFLFALGQALIYARRQNAYALVLSHAIWGMVLLIHFTW